MSDTDVAYYDTKVAELEEDVFRRCAEQAVIALTTGPSVTIQFEPGDASRYQFTIGGRRMMVISSGGEELEATMSFGSTPISFGTENNMQHACWGRIRDIQPPHGWSAAVWRRLLDAIRQRLEE